MNELCLVRANFFEVVNISIFSLFSNTEDPVWRICRFDLEMRK